MNNPWVTVKSQIELFFPPKPSPFPTPATPASPAAAAHAPAARFHGAPRGPGSPWASWPSAGCAADERSPLEGWPPSLGPWPPGAGPKSPGGNHGGNGDNSKWFKNSRDNMIN